MYNLYTVNPLSKRNSQYYLFSQVYSWYIRRVIISLSGPRFCSGIRKFIGWEKATYRTASGRETLAPSKCIQDAHRENDDLFSLLTTLALLLANDNGRIYSWIYRNMAYSLNSMFLQFLDQWRVFCNFTKEAVARLQRVFRLHRIDVAVAANPRRWSFREFVCQFLYNR